MGNVMGWNRELPPEVIEQLKVHEQLKLNLSAFPATFTDRAKAATALMPRHIWIKNPTAHKVIVVYAPSGTNYTVENVGVKDLFELKFTQVGSRPREDHPSTIWSS